MSFDCISGSEQLGVHPSGQCNPHAFLWRLEMNLSDNQIKIIKMVALGHTGDRSRPRAKGPKKHIVTFCPFSCICISETCSAGDDTFVFIKGLPLRG